MSTAFQVRGSTAATGRFIVIPRRLVAIAFPWIAAGIQFGPVRSQSLCDVAGSLWGRPHFFAGRTGGGETEAACVAVVDFIP
jgi:hypothetical protein